MGTCRSNPKLFRICNCSTATATSDTGLSKIVQYDKDGRRESQYCFSASQELKEKQQTNKTEGFTNLYANTAATSYNNYRL
jgi:hypothetical protein